jgi:hypothetical protein
MKSELIRQANNCFVANDNSMPLRLRHDCIRRALRTVYIRYLHPLQGQSPAERQVLEGAAPTGQRL